MISFKKRIIVVREPISGLLGIHSLYGLVKSKIAFTQGESLYVVFFTKNHRRIKVLHIDAAGVDLTTDSFSKEYSCQTRVPMTIEK